MSAISQGSRWIRPPSGIHPACGHVESLSLIRTVLERRAKPVRESFRERLSNDGNHHERGFKFVSGESRAMHDAMKLSPSPALTKVDHTIQPSPTFDILEGKTTAHSERCITSPSPCNAISSRFAKNGSGTSRKRHTSVREYSETR